MPMQLKSGFVGLHTNIAESQMGPGALLGAENVVIRRPGAIEPRDGVQRAGTVTTGYAAWGFSWRTKDFILRNNASNVFNWVDTTGATYRFENLATAQTVDPQPLRRDLFSRAEARASQYVPCSLGVVKMETDAGPWKMAGLPHSLLMDDAFGVSSSYGSWLPNNEKAGYRAVLVNKDANGMVLRSKPTGVVVKSNATGGAVGVTLRLYVIGYAAAIDWTGIELYRTRNFPVANVVDDEMQLVADIPKANFTLLSGSWYIDYVDRVAVAERGATLYTSPSRGGIGGQNERPPAAAAAALFKGSVFFGNVRSQRRIKVSARFLGTISTAAGIGVRLATADRTNGSNQLLNVTPTTGLEKGMYVNVGGLAAHVTAISGSTVTINVNAISTLVGGSYAFADAVKISGDWVPIGNLTGYTPNPLLVIYTVTDILTQSLYPPEGGNTDTFVFESLSRDTTAQTIQATHGSEYTPPLPNFDGTPLAMEQDTWPGGLMWSKTDEPEHVAPGNYVYVGDVNKAILGLVPTRDALFILKEDGVFRLTGAAGEWRVDPVDPTTFCVLPNSVRAMHGKGYFLSQKGVLTISDEGLELVSAPVDDVWKPLIDGIVSRYSSTGFYELANAQGSSYACVYERENEYTLMTSDTGPAYVFNANTGAWTTWLYYKHASETLPNRSLFNFERLGRCVYGLGVDYYTTLLSTSAVISGVLAVPRFDRETSVTVSSYSAVASTVTLSAPANALLDDLLLDAGGKLWRVTANVTASATVPVRLMGDAAGAAFSTGGCVLYRSLRCSATIGFMEPSALQKRWGRIVTAWSQLVGVPVLRHAFQSSEYATSIEEDTDLKKRVNGFAVHTYGYAHSWPVPTAHARAWAIRASTKWLHAHGTGRLEGIAIGTMPMEEASPAEVAA